MRWTPNLTTPLPSSNNSNNPIVNNENSNENNNIKTVFGEVEKIIEVYNKEIASLKKQIVLKDKDEKDYRDFNNENNVSLNTGNYY